ncbi:hypothetical protein ABID42_004314 [Arcicella rosea]
MIFDRQFYITSINQISQKLNIPISEIDNLINRLESENIIYRLNQCNFILTEEGKKIREVGYLRWRIESKLEMRYSINYLYYFLKSWLFVAIFFSTITIMYMIYLLNKFTRYHSSNFKKIKTNCLFYNKKIYSIE